MKRLLPLAIGTAVLMVLMSLAIVSLSATAAVLNVTPGESIQAAIDAASDDDTVLVAPGIYVENIDFKGKAITVKSTSGPSVTTIDGDNSGTVVTFNSGEGQSSVIEGFTITSGNVTNSDCGGSAGGGILCDGASPIIRNNIITNNYAKNTHSGGGWDGGGTAGGGIACNHEASPTIEGNTISHNTGYSWPSWGASGGGISVAHHSKPIIRNNTISHNLGDGDANGGGILCIYDGSAVIEGNVIMHNRSESKRSSWSGAGGGITCYKNSHPYIINNLIAYNIAKETAGGQAAGGIFDRWDSYPTIESSTIVFNEVEGGSKKAGGIWDSWWRISVHNSIVWGNTGGADISIGTYTNYWEPPADYAGGVAYCDFNVGKYRDKYDRGDITNGDSYGAIGNINANPLFLDVVSDDFHLQSGSPCIDTGTNVGAPATDLEGRERPWDGTTDMGCYEFGAPLPTVPMASFVIDHAKIDFKKKPDDDKVRVQGKLERDTVNGDGVDISEDVTVTVGPLSETITMVEMGKKGEKWEYKRPKGATGDIKKMTIDWKNGKFDIRIDKAELSGLTNPVTISVQIGDDVGEETIVMREKKHHWDYKAEKPKKTGPAAIEPLVTTDEVKVVAYPNPIRDVDTATFQVMGTLATQVEEIRVQIYDLSGRLVWEDTALGSELDWHTDCLSGDYLANGIYLYRVQLRIDGSWISQDLGKIAVLR